MPSPYIQIKGANKEAVTAAGSALKLDGSYTTKVPFLSSFPYMLCVISLLFPLVFLNEELPSNSFGKTTTSSEKFKWNPYTTSSSVARTCGIHSISGNQVVSALSPLLSLFCVLCLKWFSLHLKGSSNSTSEASPRRDGSSIDNVLDDMQSRIKRLERWHTINTVWHQKLIVFKRLNRILFGLLCMITSKTYGGNTGTMDILDVCARWLFSLPKEAPVILNPFLLICFFQ